MTKPRLPDPPCVVCGHPGWNRLKVLVDNRVTAMWYLCSRHAKIIAQQDFLVQVEPTKDGKYLSPQGKANPMGIPYE